MLDNNKDELINHARPTLAPINIRIKIPRMIKQKVGISKLVTNNIELWSLSSNYKIVSDYSAIFPPGEEISWLADAVSLLSVVPEAAAREEGIGRR